MNSPGFEAPNNLYTRFIITILAFCFSPSLVFAQAVCSSYGNAGSTPLAIAIPNVPSPQSENIEIEFVARPSNSQNSSGVFIGVGTSATRSYSAFQMAARFTGPGAFPSTSQAGTIDALNRNASGYSFTNRFNWQDGSSYRFLLRARRAQGTYDLDVNGQRVATNFQFRDGQTQVGQIQFLGIFAPLGASIEICDLKVRNETLVNQAPSISAISDVAIPFGAIEQRINFMITDRESSLVCERDVSVTSTNLFLFPSHRLSVQGRSSDCSLVISPFLGASGTATIGLVVRDPQGLTATRSFVASVSPPPTVPVCTEYSGDSRLFSWPIPDLPATQNDQIRLRFSATVHDGVNTTGAFIGLSSAKATSYGDHFMAMRFRGPGAFPNVSGSQPNFVDALDLNGGGYRFINLVPWANAQPKEFEVNVDRRLGVYSVTVGGIVVAQNFLMRNAVTNIPPITRLGLAIPDPGIVRVCDVRLENIVNSQPSITNQPQWQIVQQGGSASFSVQASAAGSLSYQWQRNRIDIPGAQAPVYSLSGVTGAQAGQYRAIVTSGSSSITSNEVQLSVLQALPSAITGQVAESAQISLSVTPATGLTYRWKKNGSEIGDTANMTGSQTSILRFASLSLNDAGSYSVDVSGGGSLRTSTTAQLVVNNLPTIQPPQIVVHPLPTQTVASGARVDFSVQASGGAPLSYQWSKNGVTIPNVSTPTYTISSVTNGDAGSYVVRVSNSTGQAISNPSVLTVQSSAPPAGGQAWADLSLKPGGQVVYVSPDGNDANAGSSSTNAVRSISAGLDRLNSRGNGPHQLLFECGREFFYESGTIGIKIQGLSPNEPVVISSFVRGQPHPAVCANRPILHNFGLAIDPAAVSSAAFTNRNIVVSGLHFYHSKRDPSRTGPEFEPSRFQSPPPGGALCVNTVNSVDSITLEDNYFDYCGVVLQPIGDRRATRIRLFRNIFRYAFANNFTQDNNRRSGLWFVSADGIVVEGNLFDHNGWHEDPDALAPPTKFNHNFYISSGNKNVVFRNNISTRGASHGAQLRSGGIVEDNVFEGNAAGFFVASNESYSPIDTPANWSSVKRNMVFNPHTAAIQAGDYDNKTHYREKAGNQAEGPSVCEGMLAHASPFAVWEQNVLNVNQDSVSQCGANFTMYDGRNDTNNSGGYRYGPDVLPVQVVHSLNNVIRGPNAVVVLDNLRFPSMGSTLHSLFDGNKLIRTSGSSTANVFTLLGGFNISTLDFGSGVDRNTYVGANFSLDPNGFGGPVSIPDSDRSLGAYNQKVLGGARSIDAFIARRLQQSKANFDPRLDAKAIVDWTLIGFGMPAPVR